jgi:hypothetical protein
MATIAGIGKSMGFNMEFDLEKCISHHKTLGYFSGFVGILLLLWGLYNAKKEYIDKFASISFGNGRNNRRSRGNSKQMSSQMAIAISLCMAVVCFIMCYLAIINPTARCNQCEADGLNSKCQSLDDLIYSRNRSYSGNRYNRGYNSGLSISF